MTRQITDQLYIELDYFTPEEYYVYNANAVSSISSSSTLTCEASAIGQTQEATAVLESAFTQSALGGLNKVAEATISSTGTVVCQTSKLVSVSLDLGALFSPSLTVLAIRNSTAVIDSVFAISTEAVANRSAQITLATIGNLNSQAAKTAVTQSNLTAQFSVTAQSQSVKSAQSSLSSQFAQNFLGGKLLETSSDFNSLSSVTTFSRVLLRNTTVTVRSGGMYDPITYDASVKKFGSHSVFFGNDTDIYPRDSENDISVVGSTFYIVKIGYTWTSNDGVSWTRNNNDLTEEVDEVYFVNNQLVGWSQSVSNKLWYSSNGVNWTSTTSFTTPGGFVSSGVIVYVSGSYHVLGYYPSSSWRIGRRSSTTLTSGWSTSEISNTGISTANTIYTDFKGYSTYGIWGFSGRTSGGTRYSVVGRYASTPTSLIVYNSNTGDDRYLNSVNNDGGNNWAVSLQDAGTNNYYLRYTTNAGTNWTDDTSINPINEIAYANSRWFVTGSAGTWTGTSPSALTKINDRFYPGIRGNATAWIRFNDNQTGRVLRSTNGSTWTTNDITNVSGVPANIVYTRGDLSDLSNWSTLDFWYRTTTVADFGGLNQRIFTFEGTNGVNVLYRTREFLVLNPFSAITITANTWHHIRISRSGTTTAIYLNGTRQGIQTMSWATNAELRLGHGNDFYIDELLISDTLITDPSVTSFTPPTQPWTQDSATDLLVHFDNSAEDDAKFDVIVTAQLSASTTVAATVDPLVKSAESAMSSSSQLSVAVTKQVSALTSLSAQTTFSSDAARFRSAASDVNAQSQLTAVVGVRKPFSISVGALFTPSFDIDARLAGVALLQSSFAQSASAVKTARITRTLSSQSDLTTQATITAGLSSSMAVQTTVSVSSIRIRFATVDLASTATLSADTIKLRPTSSDLSVSATVTVAVDKLKRTTVAVSSESSLSATAVKTATASSTQSSQFAQSTIYTRLKFGSSEQSSQFAQTTTAVKSVTVISTQPAAATAVISSVITARPAINIGALFTPSFDADAGLAGVALLESRFTVTAIIGSIKQFNQGNIWYNSGVQVLDYDKYPRLLMDFVRGTFNEILVRDNGFTLSVWAKRDTILSNQFQPMISSINNSGEHWGAFTFYNGNVMIRLNFDPDEPNPTWEDVSTDTDWHHYLFYTTTKGVDRNPISYYRLWVDGVYQGERTLSAFNDSMVFDDNTYMTLGRATIASLDGPPPNGSGQGYQPQFVYLDGALAQVWMGEVSSTSGQSWNPPVEYFYNQGYVELFDDGRGVNDQLPQPLVYNRLTLPWTGVEFRDYAFDIYQESQKQPDLALSSGWFADSRLTVNTLGVFLFGAFPQVVTSLSTPGQARRGINENLTATSALSIQSGGGLFGGSAQLESNVTVTVTVAKTTGYESNVSSQAQLTVLPGFFERVDSTLSSQFILDASVDVRPPTRAEANLVFTAGLSATVASFTDSIILTVSAATVTAEVTVIPPIRIEANLSATTALTAIVGSVEQFAVLVASAGTMTITPVKTARVLSSQTVTANTTAVANKFTGIIETLTAFNSVLTVGDVINIDPFLQLQIEPESRTLTIHRESRLLEIEQETRILLIEGWE